MSGLQVALLQVEACGHHNIAQTTARAPSKGGGARGGLGRAMLRPGGLPDSTCNSPQLPKSHPMGSGRAVQPPQSALDSGTVGLNTSSRAVAGPFHKLYFRGGI